MDIPTATTTVDNDQIVTFDFTKEKEQYDRIIADFKDEREKVLKRRQIRENKRNVDEERKKGTILEDETIIPDRTINSNIRQGRGPYVNYITQAERMLLITSLGKPKENIGSLETWFTNGMRYPHWKLPWIRAIDGMHTHGGCALEVMYDPEKPLHCTIEYIPRENLIFPRKTKDIQALPRLIRCYELTVLQLEEFAVKYEFDESVVKEVIDRQTKSDDFIKTYRVLLKKQGVVYNVWYVNEVDRWLREPQEHDIGLFNFDPEALQAPDPISGLPMFLSPTWSMMMPNFAVSQSLKEYPLYWFPYEVTENEVLLETQGRTALDIQTQEALTETMTSTVNACIRASKLYPTAKEEPGADPSLRELGRIKHGSVMSHDLSLMQFPWPNNIILAVKQALELTNAQDTGQSDFAAMARKDANKTATEMNLGEKKQESVTTTDMDIFSSPVLDTLVCCFNIARHQGIMGLVTRPSHPELLIGDYNCQPAGDIEVTKRMRDDQNMKELFNIVKGTPLAQVILIMLIKRFFPDQADEWIAALEGPDKNAVIVQLVGILEGLLKDLENDLQPEQISALRNVIDAARSVVAQPGNNITPIPSQGTETTTASSSNASTQAAGQPAAY